jgi:uncharacterized protein YegL
LWLISITRRKQKFLAFTTKSGLEVRAALTFSVDFIWRIFNPLGTTPTGARLERILGRIIEKLNHAVDTPAYGRIKPIDIIVLTDGVPTDDPASVIEAAARELNEGLHHPNAVGIQFVQIGNEEGADKDLRALCDGPVRVSSLFLPVVAFGGLILFSYRGWLTLFLM